MHSHTMTCMNMTTISFDPEAIWLSLSYLYRFVARLLRLTIMLSKLMVRSSSEPTLPKPSSATMQPTMPDEAPAAASKFYCIKLHYTTKYTFQTKIEAVEMTTDDFCKLELACPIYVYEGHECRSITIGVESMSDKPCNEVASELFGQALHGDVIFTIEGEADKTLECMRRHLINLGMPSSRITLPNPSSATMQPSEPEPFMSLSHTFIFYFGK